MRKNLEIEIEDSNINFEEKKREDHSNSPDQSAKMGTRTNA